MASAVIAIASAGARPQTRGISAFAAATPVGDADQHFVDVRLDLGVEIAAGTTACTRPISLARAAENRMPVRNNSRAADGPILGSTYGEMTAGRIPSLVSVKPKTAVFLGDGDVADRGEPRAAAERRAVDAADHRRRQRVERVEHLRHARRIGDDSRRASSRPSSPSSWRPRRR